MANILPMEKQVAVIGALAEGSSIRSIERITGIHRDTVMRLGVRIGEHCANFMDEKMRNLDCQTIQVDEIWGFVGKKQRVLKPRDKKKGFGDAYTYIALDSDTKLIPTFLIGKRDTYNATVFMED